MKTKAILFLSMFFLATSAFSQKILTIHNKVDFICPKEDHSYWLDNGEILSYFDMYEWKITGGHFKEFGQEVKEIYRPNVTSVTVVWDNVKSIAGKAPKGTITVKVNDKNNASKIVGEGKLEQEIKSLNDIIPPSLRSSISPPLLNFGEQEVIVSLTGAFSFPGIRKNGVPVLVTEYEWKIPKGWRAKTGTISSTGTYKTSDDKISLITDASSGGEVMVRGVNDCFNSGDYSLYSYPLTFTRSAVITFVKFPKTVPLGTVSTYEFSVMSLAGISFEWEAPNGWSINGGGNTYTGSNSVQITTSKCPTNEKVRVRMVKDGVSSAWTEFPTKVVLPAIKNPTGQITQYQPSAFSLNMADNDIASVEWLVNGKSVGIVNNKSSLSFSIYESGKVKVSAKLTMKDCQSVLIPEVEVNVIKAPEPFISGPSTICDQATYTINNLPPDATVQWSSTNDKIQLISEDRLDFVMFKKKKDGMSAIQVKITMFEQIVILQKEVWIGCPSLKAYTGKQTTFDPIYPFSVDFTLCNDYFTSDSYMYFVTEMNDKCFMENSDNWDWRIRSNDAFYISHHSGNIATIKPLRVGLGNFSVRVKNECGWSNSIIGAVNVRDCKFHFFNIFPNPSTDMVNIQFKNETNNNQMFTNEVINNTSSSDITEIQLWSATSLIRTYKTDQETYQFSVSDLPKGIYFVRVIKDGKTYTEKLIRN